MLASHPDRGTNVLGAVLARATTSGDYAATATVDTAVLKPDCLAGLWAFGDSANAIGLTVGNGELTLWRCEHGQLRRLQDMDAPKTDKMRLRLTAADGFRFHYSASADGAKWLAMDGDLLGRNLPPWDRSIRVAITAGGIENATAIFNQLTIIPATKDSVR